MYIWTETKSTVDISAIFLSEALDFLRFLQIIQTLLHLQPHCRYLMQTHTHPHTHTTPITSLPRQHAVGAGQQRQSIDWEQRRRRRRRKEPQAMSSRGGEDLSEISAPWAFLPHMGKTRAQTAATALCSRPHRTLRGRMLTVQRPHCLESNSVHRSSISSIRLLEIRAPFFERKMEPLTLDDMFFLYISTPLQPIVYTLH